MEILKNFKIKDIILVIIVSLTLVLIFVQKIFFNGGDVVDNNLKKITIDDIELSVEISKTAETQYRGLSFREGLENNQGMLFLHQRMGLHEYVMRDMKFDLDFVFIGDDKVVDIAKNVSKDYKGIIKGATIYNMVLEAPAGWTDKNDIQLGDEVKK